MPPQRTLAPDDARSAPTGTIRLIRALPARRRGTLGRPGRPIRAPAAILAPAGPRPGRLAGGPAGEQSSPLRKRAATGRHQPRPVSLPPPLEPDHAEVPSLADRRPGSSPRPTGVPFPGSVRLPPREDARKPRPTGNQASVTESQLAPRAGLRPRKFRNHHRNQPESVRWREMPNCRPRLGLGAAAPRRREHSARTCPCSGCWSNCANRRLPSDPQWDQASTGSTTRPDTSVSRKSRPMWRYVRRS